MDEPQLERVVNRGRLKNGNPGRRPVNITPLWSKGEEHRIAMPLPWNEETGRLVREMQTARRERRTENARRTGADRFGSLAA